MVEQFVHHIAIALEAPEREVCKGEANGMVWILLVIPEHVHVDVAAASHYPASWLKVDPILASVAAFWALVIHMNALKFFLRRNILGRAMQTIFFGFNCVKTLNI